MSLLRTTQPWLLLVSLCGCSASLQTRYYTLESIAATSAAAPALAAESASAEPMVRLDPVVIPPELDRLELVSRRGPYQLQISDSDRWAAPLDDQIRRVLSADLAARLPPHMLADPYEPATSDARRLLSIAISEFYTDEGCSTTLRADWTLRGPAGDGELGSETVRPAAVTPCAAAPTAVPAAMSSALAALADRLAGVIVQQSARAPQR
jgi:uncharacterized lipoprotein YmbA